MSRVTSKPVAILAEDDVFLSMELVLLLHDKGYEVFTFADAASAKAKISELQAQGNPPALLMTDYGLADNQAGGGELIAHARGQQPALPVIMITGSDRSIIDADLNAKAIDASSIAIFAKPVDIDKVKDAIPNAGMGWAEEAGATQLNNWNR